MCETCGCSSDEHHHHHDHHHDHHHEGGHDHRHGAHGHAHLHDHRTRVEQLEHDLLAKNRDAAEVNRRWLAERRLLALNLVSSPGAGKTTLIERTLRDLGQSLSMCVVEGDQSTDRDAERIRQAGGSVVQLNTGKGCHLDAPMVLSALEELDPRPGGVVLIENVGNLVCPALFDLGEQAKVLVCSITEGDDKPMKYPYMFRASSLLILNKMDLLPHVKFDVGRFADDVRRVHPGMQQIELSAETGTGLGEWYRWLREQAAAVGRSSAETAAVS